MQGMGVEWKMRVAHLVARRDRMRQMRRGTPQRAVSGWFTPIARWYIVSRQHASANLGQRSYTWPVCHISEVLAASVQSPPSTTPASRDQPFVIDTVPAGRGARSSHHLWIANPCLASGREAARPRKRGKPPDPDAGEKGVVDPRVQPYGSATWGLAHLRQLSMHAASHVYAPGAGVALGWVEGQHWVATRLT